MTAQGAIEPEAVARFAEEANVNDEMVYAWGGDIPRNLPGVKETRRRADVLSFTTRRPSPGRVDYIMIRVARRQREPLKAKLRSKESSLDRAMKIAMSMLRRAAHARRPQPCPSNIEFEERFLEADITLAADYVIRALRAKDEIMTRRVGPGQRRIVTIVSSGKSTAMAPE